jgi:glutathionylspermidine synthase
MERIHDGIPRPSWRTQVLSDGLVFLNSIDENNKLVEYWREGPHYTLTQQDYAWSYEAAETLWPMCIKAGDTVLKYPELIRSFGIPEWAVPEIKRSWDKDQLSVYGRFDFRFGGECELSEHDPSLRTPKLLEFNADTPTSLLESAVVQWNWFEQAKHAGKDQWNRIYEALKEAWRRQVEIYERATGRTVRVIHFAHSAEDKSGEDYLNTVCMAAAAEEAGYKVKVFYIDKLQKSVSDDNGSFYYLDNEGEYIEILFKLYPWEWMTFIQEEGGFKISPLLPNGTTWVEPPYKMLWSNKGLLPVLWELYKDDPIRRKFLLPAYFTGKKQHDMPNFVRKPLLGREGANVTVYQNGEPMFNTDGRYGEEGFVDQELALLPNFRSPYSHEDNYALMGVWMIDGEPEGMGIRESSGPITNNTSFFVPHVIID